MRYFIISDIHGYYSVLKEELDKQGFNKDKDTLISLGDNFDRGDENWEMYRFLSALPNVILLRGNHEDCLIDLIDRGYPQSHDFQNKTIDTFTQISEHYSTDIQSTSFYKWLTSDK